MLEKLVIGSLACVITFPIIGTWGVSILGQRAFSAEISPRTRMLLKYLRTHTDDNARILVEDCGDFFGGHHLGDPYILGYLAHEVKRQFIGGPHPGTFTRVSFTTFVNGELLRKPIADYSDEELEDILECYNIGTIIVWSQISKDRFMQLGLESKNLTGNLYVFHNYKNKGFVVGAESTTAFAKINEIAVKVATSSPTILRWQFDHRFITDPPLPIKPAINPYSSVGFIHVENGNTSEFKIVFKDSPLFGIF
jgi:hypothetical protein